MPTRLNTSALFADKARAKNNEEENMTIVLDENYFAVASDDLLGYCGETNSRVIEFAGLDNVQAQMYSLVISYDDGECFETRIQDGVVALTAGLMRKAGDVDVQVYACDMQGDVYTVVKKSNILRLVIKPSLDADSKPVPALEDSLRILGKIEQCAAALTDLGETLVEQQQYLDTSQTQITQAQQRLMSQFTACLSQMNEAVQTAQECALSIQQSASQIAVNKSSTGLEKRNLLKIGTDGFDNGEVTMTVGQGGELTLNGTTGSTYTSIPLTSASSQDCIKHIPNGEYIICTNGFSKLAVCVIGYDLDDGTLVQRSLAWCEGSDVSFTVDDEFPYNYVELWLDVDTTFDNDLILPMIRYKGVTDSSWEPFTPDLQTQIDDLRKQIESLPVMRPRVLSCANIVSRVTTKAQEVTQ